MNTENQTIALENLDAQDAGVAASIETTQLDDASSIIALNANDNDTPIVLGESASAHMAAPADLSAFAQLGLAPEFLRALGDLGFTKPTEVQKQVIPKALQAQDAICDLMVSSQTGSGKTAAFLLPILQQLEAHRREEDRQQSQHWADKIAHAAAAGDVAPKKPRRKNPTDPRNFKATTPRALVLCPTRELAQQVASDAIDLVQYAKGVRIASVIGGLPYAQQIARLQNAAIVIATPGRLLDLQRSGQLDLGSVQHLIVDEADRMLDLGFSEDLEQIHKLTQKRVQTMMFSATFAPRIQELAASLMRQAQRIQVNTPQEANNNITQNLYWADSEMHRKKILDHLLRDTSIVQAIVFASTQIGCDALAEELSEAGFSAAALHGALSQGVRTRRLSALRDGRIQILVATDVAARGIDVATISHVINAGLPMKAEDYVHRIGRTGRAGRKGLAITVALWRESGRIKDIEYFTKRSIPVSVIEGLEPKTSSPPPRGKSKGGFGNKGGFGKGGFDRGSYGSAPPRRANEGGGGFRKEFNPARSDKPNTEWVRSDSPRTDKPRFRDDAPPRREGGFAGGNGHFGGDKPRFRDDAPARRDGGGFGGGFRGNTGGGNFGGERAAKPEWTARGDAPRSDKPRFRDDAPRREGGFAGGFRGNAGGGNFGGDRDRAGKPEWAARGDAPRSDKPRFRDDAPRREGGFGGNLGNSNFGGDKPFARKGAGAGTDSADGFKNRFAGKPGAKPSAGVSWVGNKPKSPDRRNKK